MGLWPKAFLIEFQNSYLTLSSCTNTTQSVLIQQDKELLKVFHNWKDGSVEDKIIQLCCMWIKWFSPFYIIIKRLRKEPSSPLYLHLIMVDPLCFQAGIYTLLHVFFCICTFHLLNHLFGDGNSLSLGTQSLIFPSPGQVLGRCLKWAWNGTLANRPIKEPTQLELLVLESAVVSNAPSGQMGMPWEL